MTHAPRTADEIYTSIRDRLKGRITKLTNFTERSFNFVWTRAFANDLRDVELQALAVELAGFIDYAGGPVDNRDLEQLGIADAVDPDEINQYLLDEDLEEFVKLVGVSRFRGNEATGEVTIDADLNSSVTIDSGTIVTTTPDSSGNTLNFQTLNTVTIPNGATTETGVPIEAVDVGEKFNLPADSIVRFADPPIGVTAVTNTTATTGGEGRESNDELRERAKAAITEQSGGGTVAGIEGFIRSNVDGVRRGDVIIEEFTDPCPPFSDVIVDGGTDQEVIDAIEASRPAAIRHNLIRPASTQIEVDAALTGTDIDTIRTKDRVEEFLTDLGLSEALYRDEIIRRIMQSDSDIINVGQLELYIQRVVNERFTFSSGTSKYPLKYTHNGENVTVVDADGNIFVEDAEYEVIDDTGDGISETINWLDTSNISDEDDFFVDYDVDQRASIVRHERNTMVGGLDDLFAFDVNETDYKLNEVPFPSSTVVEDQDGVTYTLNTDYEIVSTPNGQRIDTFEFESGRVEYALDYSTDASTVSIEDDSGDTFVLNTDFTVEDQDGDGLGDTIVWDTNNSTPDADEEFTVTYNKKNDVPQTLRWLGNATPDDGDTFTVTYDQAFYDMQYEIVDAPDDQSIDEDGTTYTEDTDYNFADYTGDGENDGIFWIDGQSRPANDKDFFTDYFNEGDREFTNREKVSAGHISISTE